MLLLNRPVLKLNIMCTAKTRVVLFLAHDNFSNAPKMNPTFSVTNLPWFSYNPIRQNEI